MKLTLSKASQIVYDRLAADIPIEQELFAETFRLMAKAISEDRLDEGSASESERKLSRWLDVQFATGLYKDSDSARSFETGAFWGVSQLLGACRSHSELGIVSERRCAVVEAERQLFEAVRNRPGITHAELASTIGKTPARLTQIITSMKDLCMFSSIRQGKYKHYYLTPTAEEAMGDPALASAVVAKADGKSQVVAESEAMLWHRQPFTIASTGSSEQQFVLEEAVVIRRTILSTASKGNSGNEVGGGFWSAYRK